MKQTFLLLCVLIGFTSMSQILPSCDSSLQIYITSQTPSQANVSLNNITIGDTYSYTFFNMQGSCVGGTPTLTSPDNIFILNQNNITDSTALWFIITDMNGNNCVIYDTLIFNNSNWELLNSTYTCFDASLVDSTMMCTSLWDPVCGCDNITYSNDCYAQHYAGLTSWVTGECIISNQTTSFCEMFDNYQNGDPIAESSSNWNSWGELMSGLTAPFADDANVSNNNFYSGNNSLYLFSGATQGLQDIVLPFGSAAPYELGMFEFSSMFYVTAATGAYFNFQAENTPGITWSLDVKMDLGTMVVENTGSGINYLNTIYPENQWFELKILCDLTNNIWEIFIDNISQGTFTNTINKVASLDLYPIAGHDFYVDDVCWSYTAPNLTDLNAQVTLIDPITGLANQNRNPYVEIRNLGINNITSFDIDFNYNGNIITENITGLNLSTTDIYQVNFNNTINLTGGINTGTATVYNVNGQGQDDDPSDDQMNIQIEALVPAEGKLVIGEEATGTWCGWCPRGAVALNWMDHDYQGYWQGIAVHNADPMTNQTYDAELGTYIGGYPSALVDRGNEIDPSVFKQDFLQRIVIPPKAIISNGAELIGNTLKVNLTAEFQSSVTGNYKLACVIVEDSVTGSGPNYYQANYYSGGASLVDVDGSDWNQKPSNVPDWQMIYRHVARGVAPTFNGSPLANSSYSTGDTETLCFEFILDPSWDQSKIHIVGMLLDNSNKIDNASSTTISGAINSGYVACATSNNYIELNGPDNINFYPNPSSENIQILNLKEEKVKIKIYDTQGKKVIEKTTLNQQKIDVSFLAKGVYTIEFYTKEGKKTRQLIKK